MYSGNNFGKRRYLAHFNSDDSNMLNLKSPILAIAWSFTFPGFGHYYVGKAYLGLVLVAWEFILNNLAKVNMSIYYSLLGDFESAKRVVDLRFFTLYGLVYIFCMWDSYFRAAENNQIFLSVYGVDKSPPVFKMSSFGINYLTKKNPWIASFWGLVVPGLEAIYNHRIFTAIYAIFWISIAGYKSQFYKAMLFSMWGNFDTAKSVLDPQWLLFLPSIFAFTGYQGYNNAIETNRLIKYEQAYFLREHYQSSDFQMPI